MKIKEILGNGSIECRGKDSYRLKFYVKYSNGTKGRISKSVFAGNKTKARFSLNQWRMELLSGTTIPTDKRITVNEMLDKYLEFCRENKKLSLKTLEGYRKIADRYLRPALGQRYIDEFTPEEVEDFFNELKRTGGEEGHPLSGATCKRIKSVLSPMFKRAIFHHYIHFNPCAVITMPPSERTEMKVLSKAEVQEILALLPGHPDQRFATALRLAVFSGCRRGELCGLKWQDVDFRRSTIHIRHSLAEVAGKDSPDGETLHLKSTKTCENRNLSIDAETISFLREHKTRQFHQLTYQGGRQTEQTPVFADDLGQWYRPSVLTRHFEQFAFKHGFAIRFHDVRHTHASILIANYMSIVDVSKRLGHAKVSTTLDTYSHMMPGQDSAIADKLGELFCQRMSPEDTPQIAAHQNSFENRVPKKFQIGIFRFPKRKADPTNMRSTGSLMVALGNVDVNLITRVVRNRYSTNSLINNSMTQGQKKALCNELPDGCVVAKVIKQQQKHHFSKVETEQIVIGYTKDRLSIYQLAEKYGCHRNTISALLKRNGVSVTKARMSSELIKEATQLYYGGLTLKETGKRLGVAETTIRRAFIQSGIVIRKPHRYGQ